MNACIIFVVKIIMSKRLNPFIIKGYYSKEYFCDRENELKILHRNFENNANTCLISARKMGKSALIFRFFDDFKRDNDTICIYLDIYQSRSINDFINLLAEAILKIFQGKNLSGSKFIRFIKSIRPVISYDPLNGSPQVQFNFQTDEEKKHNLFTLFNFLESQGKKILLVIDEFQQITFYPEKNTEALLRTYIEQLKNIHFIFCGSNQHIMNQMFTIVNRPFFGSTRLLSLDVINRKEYLSFIRLQFENNKKSISDEALDLIANWTMLHTFYTQNLCNTIFSDHNRNIEINVVKTSISEVLKENEMYYYQYRQFLTTAQWNYLIAVAKEEFVVQATSQSFIYKYSIGTPANSRRLLKSLTDKELLLEVQTHESSNYRIYDVFFLRWLQLTY